MSTPNQNVPRISFEYLLIFRLQGKCWRLTFQGIIEPISIRILQFQILLDSTFKLHLILMWLVSAKVVIKAHAIKEKNITIIGFNISSPAGEFTFA